MATIKYSNTHSKMNNFTTKSTRFQRPSCLNSITSACLMGLAALGASNFAQADTLTYDDNSPASALQDLPGISGYPNYLYIGTPANPAASDNTLTINFSTGQTSPRIAYAGLSIDTNSSNASDNHLVFMNGGVQFAAYGGYASSSGNGIGDMLSYANGNTLTMTGGSAGILAGGFATVELTSGISQDAYVQANGNAIIIYDTDPNAPSGGNILGGSAQVSNYDTVRLKLTQANNNIVTVHNVNSSPSSIMGGYSYVDYINSNSTGQQTAEASNNTVNYWGGNATYVRLFGGYVQVGIDASSVNLEVNASNNILNIAANTGEVAGGRAITQIEGANNQTTTTVNHNQVNISNGIIGNIFGGVSHLYGDPQIASIQSSYNEVNISGGEMQGHIYVGEVAPSFDASVSITALAVHNSLTISGTPIFNASNSNIYGGHLTDYAGGATFVSQDFFTGNTFNLHSKNITVNDVEGFEHYNFYIPASAVNGETMLTTNSITL